MIPSLALDMITRADTPFVRALSAAHAAIAAKPLALLAGGHMAHDEVAATVRMLHRDDLAHEAVCMIARDRIVWLAGRLAEAERALAAINGALLAGANLTAKPAGFADPNDLKFMERDSGGPLDSRQGILMSRAAGPFRLPVFVLASDQAAPHE